MDSTSFTSRIDQLGKKKMEKKEEEDWDEETTDKLASMQVNRGWIRLLNQELSRNNL